MFLQADPRGRRGALMFLGQTDVGRGSRVEFQENKPFRRKSWLVRWGVKESMASVGVIRTFAEKQKRHTLQWNCETLQDCCKLTWERNKLTKVLYFRIQFLFQALNRYCCRFMIPSATSPALSRPLIRTRSLALAIASQSLTRGLKSLGES